MLDRPKVPRSLQATPVFELVDDDFVESRSDDDHFYGAYKTGSGGRGGPASEAEKRAAAKQAKPTSYLINYTDAANGGLVQQELVKAKGRSLEQAQADFENDHLIKTGNAPKVAQIKPWPAKPASYVRPKAKALPKAPARRMPDAQIRSTLKGLYSDDVLDVTYQRRARLGRLGGGTQAEYDALPMEYFKLSGVRVTRISHDANPVLTLDSEGMQAQLGPDQILQLRVRSRGATWRSTQQMKQQANAQMIEAVRSEDDHFYGAWRTGGGRGGPSTPAQMRRLGMHAALGAKPLSPSTAKYLADLNAEIAKDEATATATGPARFRDLNVVKDWLHSKGVNTQATKPGGYAVKDPEFGLDQLTPEQRVMIFGRLEELDMKYPGVLGSKSLNMVRAIPTAHMRWGGEMDARTLANMGSGVMSFNLDYLRGEHTWISTKNGIENSPRTDWTHGQIYADGVVNHEFGHAVDNWLKRDNTGVSPYSDMNTGTKPFSTVSYSTQTGKWETVSLSAEAARLNAEWKAKYALVEKWQEVYTARATPLNRYSQKNRAERFAEAFSRIQHMGQNEMFVGKEKLPTKWEYRVQRYISKIPGWPASLT